MDEVGEIKQRLEVAEVVGSYIPLKQAGRNLKASCPFHDEKTASFMVSPDKGIWHCFGCGEGGDIYKFVMKMEGLEFRPALELLAKRAGVELSNRRSSTGTKQKERLILAHQWAIKYYQASLVKNTPALEYLLKTRKLDKSIIQQFAIGYAPDSWDALTAFLTKKGFSADELVRAGLAGKKSGVFDWFRGRIMFPIFDAQGAPVGFTGRVLQEKGGETDGPKYLNTPQTLIYDKSRAIYGLHLAKESIRQSDWAVLVEGNMDVVASHQAGLTQAVAVSGTALTADQLKILGKFSKNIRLAFDTDDAGLLATERAIDISQKLGLNLKVVKTGAKDPDELIKSDPEAWKRAVDSARYAIDYLFDRFATEFDVSTAMGKRQYSDRLAANIRRLADPVEQNHYVNLLADRLGTSSESVSKKIAQSPPEPAYATAVHTQPPRNALTKVVNPILPTGRQAVEESVLSLALAFPDSRLGLDDLSGDDFSAEETKRIYLKIRRTPTANLDKIAKALPDIEDYVKILALRGEESFSSLPPADRGVESLQMSHRLKDLSDRQTKNDISAKLQEAQSAGDQQKVKQLLRQYQDMIKKGQ